MNDQYQALIATTRVTSLNTKLAKEALDAIVEDQPKVPVRINFSGKSIGMVSRFSLNDDKLTCSFDCNIAELDKLGVYLTPGFKVKNNDMLSIDGVTQIKKMELLEVSIVSFPADKTLTPIEKEF